MGVLRKLSFSMKPLSLVCLLLISLAVSQPLPEPHDQTDGLVALNTMTLVPLLLAGAAFAKGYLIGNIEQRQSRSYGGYAAPYGGYNRVGYNPTPYYPNSYGPSPSYPHRRVDQYKDQYQEDQYQAPSA